MLDTIRICGAFQSPHRFVFNPRRDSRWKEGGGNRKRRRSERKQRGEGWVEEKKSDEMRRLLAWLHCRLQRLIPGVQSAEKTPTYNLTPTLTFLLGLLWLSQSCPVNTHLLSSGGDVTFILSCTGGVGFFFPRVCVVILTVLLFQRQPARNVAQRGK